MTYTLYGNYASDNEKLEAMKKEFNWLRNYRLNCEEADYLHDLYKAIKQLDNSFTL